MANTRFSALAMLMVVGILIFGDYQVSAYQDCGVNLPQILSQCWEYLQIPGPKVPPSTECCTTVKPVDLPCACTLVTPDIEKRISMEKAVYVGRTCGLSVRAGTECGSYTVPPPLKI